VKDDYSRSWSQYRLGWLFVWVLALGWIPTMLLLLRFSGSSLDLMWIVALIYLVLFSTAQFRLLAWRCPRCGKMFAGNWFPNRIYLVSKCVHCGLPKYANSSPEESERG